MARPLALYRLSDKAVEEGQDIIELKAYMGLRDFVVALILKSRKDNKQLLSRQDLTDGLAGYVVAPSPGKEPKPLSTANSMISRRVKELEALGCLTIKKEMMDIDGKKKLVNIHHITSLQPLRQHILEKDSRSPAPQGRPKKSDLVVYSDMLEGKGITKLEGDGDVIPYTEGAFSILEVVARSRVDSQTTISCRYHIMKDDFVEVTSTTSSKEGAGIMFSSDQRIIQALNGMLKQAHDEAQPDLFNNELPARVIGEYCFFDIYALTREIGLKANKIENRNNVRKMIDRLKDTNFEVDAANSKFWRDRYMPDSDFTKGEYRYITEFYSAEDWYSSVGEDKNSIELAEDRYFVVKFHPLIFKAMTTAQMAFINHEALKSERYDLVHRLNNWVKPTIGVRDKGRGDSHHKYPLDIFQQRVRPASAMQHFETQFYNLLKRQDAREDEIPHSQSVRFVYDECEKPIPEGVFWLNGYYFKVEINKELADELYRKARSKRKRRKEYPVLTIWRDKDDVIVGDNSDHNQALRRQMKNLNAPVFSESNENPSNDIFALTDDEMGSV